MANIFQILAVVSATSLSVIDKVPYNGSVAMPLANGRQLTVTVTSGYQAKATGDIITEISEATVLPQLLAAFEGFETGSTDNSFTTTFQITNSETQTAPAGYVSPTLPGSPAPTPTPWKFDPITGQPIGSQVTKFDPETGLPISSNSSTGATYVYYVTLKVDVSK